MNILCIETSTSCCSAAICIDGVAVASKENLAGANHASELPVFVEQLLAEARANQWHLDAVALSQGPGSYTGLRIGTSIAKGICYGMNIPLIPVDTLQILCNSVDNQYLTGDTNTMYCPMIDARRMEVYTAFFNDKLEKISDTEALIVDENSFMELKQNNHLYLFGDGADKLADLFENEDNITVVEKFHCSAAYMAKLADEAFKNKQFVDVAYFEPFYLKNFVPGMPKVKGLD